MYTRTLSFLTKKAAKTLQTLAALSVPWGGMILQAGDHEELTLLNQIFKKDYKKVCCFLECNISNNIPDFAGGHSRSGKNQKRIS
jgi:hypothetical protein